MSFILKIRPKYRLVAGIVISIIALILLYIIRNYETGFFGGFITGLLIALGLGLLITYNKKV